MNPPSSVPQWPVPKKGYLLWVWPCLCVLGCGGGSMTWPDPQMELSGDGPVHTDRDQPARAITATFLNPFLTLRFI